MMLTCTACNPTELEMSDSSDWDLQLAMLKDKEVSELPDRLNVKVTDALDINASILIPEEKKDNEASRLTMKRHIFSDDQMKENVLTLMKNGPFPQDPDKIERMVSGNAYEDKKERMRYDLSVDTYSGVVGVADGMMLMTNESARLMDVLRFPFGDESVQFYYKENQELDFGKWEDAWKCIKNVSDKCGIASITDMRCYALDQKTLQQCLDMNHEQGNDFYFKNTGNTPQYTKEDEAYFFEFQQGYDGIPVCKYQLQQTLERQDFGYGTYAYGYALYSNKGLIDFEVSNLFDMEKAGKKQKIVPLSEVLDKSVSGLKNLIAGKTSAEIREISLCYLPVLKDAAKMEFEAEPVWVVAYIQTGIFAGETPITMSESKYDVYNAFTGEKLY